MDSKRQFIILFIAVILISSCSKPRQVMDKDEVFTYRCADIVDIRQPDTLSVQEIKNDTFLLNRYDYIDLQIANAFGLYDELRSYEEMKEGEPVDSISVAALVEFVKMGSRITEATNLADLEVQSVIDLVDCTVLQLRRYKSKLSKANLRSQNRLSNWAIVTGAVTTIITAGILISNNAELITSSAFDWIAVAGGIAAGYLAIKSAKVDKKIYLKPGNQFVRSIWNGENENEVFPASIWHLMTTSFITTNGEESTLRDQIIEEWKTSENMLGNEDNLQYLDVLLGDQGLYNEEMIDLRIEMLEMLNTGIDQINRSLYLFNAKRY